MREIIYNGKALPLHFGMKSLSHFANQNGLEFGELVSSADAVASIEFTVSITTSGLNEGARRSGADIRYTENDVWDMFDDEPNLVLRIAEIFIESITPLINKLDPSLTKNSLPTAIQKPKATRKK
ncbi:MAG: hypothetical protein R3Y49_03075 [Rikenellaceae bacterium]